MAWVRPSHASTAGFPAPTQGCAWESTGRGADRPLEGSAFPGGRPAAPRGLPGVGVCLQSSRASRRPAWGLERLCAKHVHPISTSSVFAGLLSSSRRIQSGVISSLGVGFVSRGSTTPLERRARCAGLGMSTRTPRAHLGSSRCNGHKYTPGRDLVLAEPDVGIRFRNAILGGAGRRRPSSCLSAAGGARS